MGIAVDDLNGLDQAADFELTCKTQIKPDQMEFQT